MKEERPISLSIYAPGSIRMGCYFKERFRVIKQGVHHKAILHLDMDAFYAAVEVMDNPCLKGRPVIVGGGRERGVVSSGSYEAREYGIHSAQPMATAMRLCPHGVFLPVRMSRYRAISDRIFEIFSRFTPLVETLSLDEAFLDVTRSTHLFGSPEEIAGKIKALVREEIGLTVSAGVAPSRLVAKIASDLNKPDGLTIVPPEGVKQFLDPLPVERLWGVGKATAKVLASLGVRTIKDLSHLPRELLKAKFGKQGTHLHLLSQGIDERGVEPEREMKSVGSEETYADDILDVETIKRELLSLSLRVARRLRHEGVCGRTITLKVKYHNFVHITRSVTLPAVTDDGSVLFRTCCGLLEKTEAGKRPLRLLGISLSHLSIPRETAQLPLFYQNQASDKRKKLTRALDTILEKFGDHALLPSTLIEK